MNHNLRRWLLAGAFTAAGIAGAAAYDAATHTAEAAPKNPGAVVERPGGALDHQLPTQASDRAKQVTAKVTPGSPECEQPKTEPAHKPKPKPKPKPQPSVEVPPVADEPDSDPPTTKDPKPEPHPDPVDTLPSTDPAPLPDADDLISYPTPAPIEPTPTPVVMPTVPALEVPALPLLLAPTTPPAEATDPPAALAIRAAATDDVADCDEVHDAINVNRDAIRQLLAHLTGRATPKTGKRCPGDTDTGEAGPGSGSVSNCNCTTSWVIADLTTTHTTPALTRIEHTRARSTIPTGRHTAIEPGPA